MRISGECRFDFLKVDYLGSSVGEGLGNGIGEGVGRSGVIPALVDHSIPASQSVSNASPSLPRNGASVLDSRFRTVIAHLLEFLLLGSV